MHFKNKTIQQRYYGFLKTPNLWIDDIVFQLQQLEPSLEIDTIDIDIDEKQRLGKYIEHFVTFNLKKQKEVKVVAENIQIQEEKRTIGEVDCIYSRNENTTHLEIVYKFYLFVPDPKTSELHCFIGPNKKDSLLQKLDKLKNKQLPLLYHSATKTYLDNLNLKANSIQQKVCFKAQVFVPLKRNITFKKINKNCISGFYINKYELENFKNCKFFIPIKKDWLVIPHPQVNWLTFLNFKINALHLLSEKFSPLCWVKKENGEIKKFFLIWWDVN